MIHQIRSELWLMRSTNVTLHGSFSWSLYFCNFVICLGIRFSILSVFPLTRFRYRVLTQLIKAVLCVSLNPIPPARVVDSPITLRVRVRFPRQISFLLSSCYVHLKNTFMFFLIVSFNITYTISVTVDLKNFNLISLLQKCPWNSF